MRKAAFLMSIIILSTRRLRLNATGYTLLNGGKPSEAIDVFLFAVERHARSANAHESLSEAYERNGRTREALAEARKALTLNPVPNVRAAAEDRIARLSGK